jgi:predicted alpha/beta-hydrolase family hydrolase
MAPTLLYEGPEDAPATILLAHGAGAPMDSASMNATSGALAAAGFRVARFEFSYMAARRDGNGRKPPPRADKLIPEYREAVESLGPVLGRLIIGGKSMGGRVASMVADELYKAGRTQGLLCLGYPFHPPQRPAQLRTAHLATLRIPTLICQGTRDEFGSRDDVAGYELSPAIEMLWLEDGDHDLRPRKSVSGFSAADHLRTMAATVAAWIARPGPGA